MVLRMVMVCLFGLVICVSVCRVVVIELGLVL